MYITINIRYEEDASYKEYKNIVTCAGTLSFWNVGALVDGKGGVTSVATCTASINGVSGQYTASGTFTGGPNGVFTMHGEGGNRDRYDEQRSIGDPWQIGNFHQPESGRLRKLAQIAS